MHSFSFEISSYLLELCYCPQLFWIYDLWLWHAQTWTLHSQAVWGDQCLFCWREPYLHYTVLDLCVRLIPTPNGGLKRIKQNLLLSSWLDTHTLQKLYSGQSNVAVDKWNRQMHAEDVQALLLNTLNCLLTFVGWSWGNDGCSLHLHVSSLTRKRWKKWVLKGRSSRNLNCYKVAKKLKTN